MWYDIALNPSLVKSIFGNDIPSLSNSKLLKVCLDRDGPIMEVIFEIENFPTSPPIKWTTNGYNTARVCIRLIEVSNVNLGGVWENNNCVNIDFKEIDETIFYFNATGSAFEIKTTFKWLQILSINGYKKG